MIDGALASKKNVKIVFLLEFLVVRTDANVRLDFLMIRAFVILAFSKGVLIVILGELVKSATNL